MTQPPNQPPHGGFGPPPDHQPQGGGFGAPTTSPPPHPGLPPQQPQPGYGYPQQPGPYGAPAAPGTPGPYGYPQQPQQPGYGYPAQPPTVPANPWSGQGGDGRRNRTALSVVVAAVVAIALIIGGGIWYAKSSGGDGKKHDTGTSTGSTGGKDGTGGTSGGSSTGGTEKAPADSASSVLFKIPMPKTDGLGITSGSWLTDKVYAKSGIAEIVGYDPAKGSKLWTVKLPGPICSASSHVTSDNRTAVVFRPRTPAKNTSVGCTRIAAIDLDAGKALWMKSVKTGDVLMDFSHVTVGQRTVAAGGLAGGTALDIDSGKLLWRPKPDGTCRDLGYGGGAKLVAVRTCDPYGNEQLHIQTIGPGTGKVISDYTMPSGIEDASVVSTDPLVVAADVGHSAGDGSGVSDYFSIDNTTGRLRTRISAPGDTYAGRCNGISHSEDCKGIVVGNDRLYLATERHDGNVEYSKTNEIVAFDLDTGKQTGQRAAAGDGYALYPLRMDGGNLLAYKSPPYDKGGQIVSIDGGSFQTTKLMENPATRSVRMAEAHMLPEFAEIRFGHGRLYMSAVFAKRVDTEHGGGYLVLAFGTGD
ncbi:hypothetical protein LK07_20815 [Streptomyces pluripotens]|uniref:Pyrrolo-quinoline quinone repeat domain-containing protein n=1 Tax=Streptomyces pluripotens TaxID=1355015 RepID=A0A221P1T2_9ACTN|nr:MULTISPECIES: PQQ-binding-like beta-propeller repeat protein [Streptomyces]ARP71795.1 hypothetical protein LK06_019650 [Streptomyces pluripotens]ASN26046.1 hypothetical protein LK07_20815 [Streptomyces pluripotens]MCH0556271.1 PQQ-binding-like beta-propeller repeat protein [Streptomyces sp. MUM 16J]